MVQEYFIKNLKDPNNLRTIHNYYKKDYVMGTKKNGTSNFHTYLVNRCKKYPSDVDIKQKSLSFMANIEGGDDKELVTEFYNVEKVSEAIIVMIITNELPFSYVEN